MRGYQILTLPCALLQLFSSHARASSVSPVVFPPSQNWDGIDGPWSTFSVRLGNPEQVVRVIPSTSGYNVIVAIPSACNLTADYTGCVTARAGVFEISGSKTWQAMGRYGIGMQANLGWDVGAEFGLDKVGLGVASNPDVTFAGQVIGGVDENTNETYIGTFGLGTQPTNFTNLTDPHTSFFTSLKDTNRIPSYTWSYTAGAKYQLTGALATLIFGGYDSSKFIPNDLTIPMSPDTSRDLVVGLQSITASYSAGSKLMMPSGGIFAMVDSTMPYMWLPLDACEQFERAFGLTWDSKQELYLVNDTLHTSLTNLNPEFKFKIGISKVGGQSVDLVISYNAFDLEAKPPFVKNATRYFPLKRAVNDTQYTLGRAFLQETYLIADYERGNFSLSQCTFEAGAKPTITTIKSIADANAPAPAASSSVATESGKQKSKSGAGIGTGAIAAIIIVVVVLITIGAALFWMKKKQKWFWAPPRHELESGGDGEMPGDPTAVPLADSPHGSSPHEPSAYNTIKSPAVEAMSSPLAEMQDVHPVAGFYSKSGRHEMQGDDRITAELASPQDSQVHEMFDASVYREMHSSTSTQARNSPSGRTLPGATEPFSWLETPVSEYSELYTGTTPSPMATPPPRTPPRGYSIPRKPARRGSDR